MTTTGLLLLFLFLKAQICYSQGVNSGLFFNNFKKDIAIEQREHAGVIAMDDETKVSYYLLVGSCSVADLMRYTNDSNPVVRSYVFAGLLRRNISKAKLLNILNTHKNDTAKFTSGGADVVTEWTVKEFMEAGWRLKISDELPAIDYKKELEKRRTRSVLKLKITGISHGLIDKKELLTIDRLTLADKELKVVSFTLFIDRQEMKSSNCLLTNQMKQAIEGSESGEFLVFGNIKIAGKGGIAGKLASLVLKLK